MRQVSEEVTQLLPVGEEQPAPGRGRLGLKRLAWAVAALGTAGLLYFSQGLAPVPAAPRFVGLFDKGVCSAEGTWEDSAGAVDFKVTDSEVSLTVAGLPRLLVAMGANGVERFEVNNASVDIAKDFTKEARLGVASVAKAMGRGRAQGLSKYLASRGWNGADRPCAYPLHMLLLQLAKEEGRVDRELIAEPKLDHTGPYGFEAECPAKKEATWECRVETKSLLFWVKATLGPWMAAGSKDLGVGHSSLLKDVKCQNKAGNNNPTCQGLCGKGCDCWESVCGSNYLCEYNPVCCAHAKECVQGLKTPMCIKAIYTVKACSNQGLKIWGPDSKVF